MHNNIYPVVARALCMFPLEPVNASSGKGCGYTGYVGFRFSNDAEAYINPMSDLSACLDACDASARCTAVYWLTSNGRDCFLTYDAGSIALVTQANYEAYIRDSRNCGTPNVNCPRIIEANVDYASELALSTETLYDCDNICMTDPNCIAYSLNGMNCKRFSEPLSGQVTSSATSYHRVQDGGNNGDSCEVSHTSPAGCAYDRRPRASVSGDAIGFLNHGGDLGVCLAACDSLMECTAVTVTGTDTCWLYDQPDPNNWNMYDTPDLFTRQSSECGAVDVGCPFVNKASTAYATAPVLSNASLALPACFDACEADANCQGINYLSGCELLGSPLGNPTVSASSHILVKPGASCQSTGDQSPQYLQTRNDPTAMALFKRDETRANIAMITISQVSTQSWEHCLFVCLKSGLCRSAEWQTSTSNCRLFSRDLSGMTESNADFTLLVA